MYCFHFFVSAHAKIICDSVKICKMIKKKFVLTGKISFDGKCVKKVFERICSTFLTETVCPCSRPWWVVEMFEFEEVEKRSKKIYDIEKSQMIGKVEKGRKNVDVEIVYKTGRIIKGRKNFDVWEDRETKLLKKDIKPMRLKKVEKLRRLKEMWKSVLEGFF